MFFSLVVTILTLESDLVGRKSDSAFRRNTRCLDCSPIRYKAAIAALLTLVLTTATGHARDKIEMELTVVKGNKELPKILYIVPWKRLADGNIQQKLVLHSLFEDAFDPIEPHAFERYVDDYRYFANSQSK